MKGFSEILSFPFLQVPLSTKQAMVDALVTGILEQLGRVLVEPAQQELKLVIGVDTEIKKLQSNFESIHALLDDAEEKQNKERSIKLWLVRLKEVCYDIEDVLDEWSTALLKLKIDERDCNSASDHSEVSSVMEEWGTTLLKVCRLLFPCFSLGIQLVHRGDIAQKIKGLNERLDVANERKRFQLIPRDSKRHIKREESTTFADASKLHGRDEVKKQLVESLLCDSSDQGEMNIKTISVVGMGGMGKTTLAQLIYKDRDVARHFDIKIWVCVSEDFDLIRVVKEILGSADPGSAQNLASLGLQIILERICESIEGKKVLLVLDDVWTDQGKNWESLKQAFAAVALGSRILVTTRKDTVAEAMKSFRVHLNELSDEVCWKILCQEAFGVKSGEQCKSLEDIGTKIAKKCRGLPLAAKTLGGMLQSKKTRGEWENVLLSEMWELYLVQKDLFVPLLLSYYDLPSAIRRCFLYCSIFPKDYDIDRDSLIRSWMAQGYLSSIENPEPEETGIEYFECLVALSFFQNPKERKDGSVTCKMHDVVVDFARFLMGSELVMAGTEGDNSSSTSFENIRHLSIKRNKDTREVTPRVPFGAKNLRSINSFTNSLGVGSDLLSLCFQQKHLRSLDTNGGSLGLHFPEEVAEMMHLRLLDFSYIFYSYNLPEALCELCNLQTLYLRVTNLPSLPSKMDRLISLRHLDTTGCIRLKSYPKRVARLTSLRELRGAVVRCDRNDDEEFSLGDLENLSHLRHLEVMRLNGDKVDINEARRPKLHSKMYLKQLKLCIRSTMDGDDVIQVLNPSSRTNVILLPDELERSQAIHRRFI